MSVTVQFTVNDFKRMCEILDAKTASVRRSRVRCGTIKKKDKPVSERMRDTVLFDIVGCSPEYDLSSIIDDREREVDTLNALYPPPATIARPYIYPRRPISIPQSLRVKVTEAVAGPPPTAVPEVADSPIASPVIVPQRQVSLPPRVATSVPAAPVPKEQPAPNGRPVVIPLATKKPVPPRPISPAVHGIAAKAGTPEADAPPRHSARVVSPRQPPPPPQTRFVSGAESNRQY